MKRQLVIVGASYAGVTLAGTARELGFDGSIVLLGDEAHPPYQRPPLSKGFLTGKANLSSMWLKSQAFFEESDIALQTSCRVGEIDRESGHVLTEDNGRIAFDALAFATGARRRELQCEGAHLDGIVYLRTLDDAQAMLASTGGVERVAVIGGGFIGLEVAASLAMLGKQVDVIEAAPRLMARAVHPETSAFFLQLHARHGVRMHLDAQLQRIEGRNGRVSGVVLADGSVLECDLVVAGIGVIPNDELAAACGLQVDNGIVVDEYARSSDPAIVAAGDCARYPNPWAGGSVRLESVQSANDLARTAAATVCGRPAPYNAVPWFWSDQYDCKLQMAGIAAGWNRTVLRGSPQEGAFSVFCFRDGELLAVESVNRMRDHMAARKLLARRVELKDAWIEDTGFDLSGLAK
jgi:3-phenylpropionate/trans-cinnamate dioxygenase ferredoxin reductase subunit